MRFETVSTSDRCSSRDREVIRIDHRSDPLGIAAALRRAFSEPPAEQVTEPDFEDLLLKLN